jgi:hypothetical protein
MSLRNDEKITELECGTEAPPNHDGSTLTLDTLAAELPFRTPTLFTYSFAIPKLRIWSAEFISPRQITCGFCGINSALQLVMFC